ncbi:hypothetical protein GS424_009125 [Eggerthella guodeyinii]|uniref:Uncharacterized protein n=1 Tax=Eggerthella guodeyinii TaxID=2690837 RepID=A0A6L7ISV6_9ACTN|nr:hypothetical protein [Eggerthella guodeyinii]QOS66728.1 hypothetical protein GS424_009125 [Eggerthella guodeyinii]
MNIVENYKLIYDGAGMHEILGLAKSQTYANAAKQADSKALAEYFLDRVRFDRDFRTKYSIDTGSFNMSVSKSDSNIARQIDHIHENCGQEIRSKWAKPQLSDKEVVDALYADRIEKELAKISDKVDVVMPL